MANAQEMVFISIKMEIFTLESLLIRKNKEMEFINLLKTGQRMRVSGKLIKDMEKGNIHSKMEATTMDNGLMELGKAEEIKLAVQILIIQEAGKTTKRMDLESRSKDLVTHTREILLIT